MALLNQFQYTYEKDTVTIFASIKIGASGAVSSLSGQGLLSAEKETEDGQYTLTLKDNHNCLLAMHAQVIDNALSGVAAVQLLADPATLQADFKSNKSLLLQCLDFAGAEVNPPSGSSLNVMIVARKSTVGPAL